MKTSERIRIVGPVREMLLREGKISFAELVDKSTGRLRTLEELGFSEGGKPVLGMPPEKESFIERITGARAGTPESILKNAQAVNPNYGKERGYDTNCQRCFPAYELRRRGHDVEAMPNDEKMGSGTSKRDAFGGWECFKNAKVKGFFNGDEPIGREHLLSELKGLPDGARSGIIWTWPDKSRSHIIACEIFNGQPIFVDPQSGKTGKGTLGISNEELGYSLFRTDNLELKEDFEWNEIIRKKRGSR